MGPMIVVVVVVVAKLFLAAQRQTRLIGWSQEKSQRLACKHSLWGWFCAACALLTHCVHTARIWFVNTSGGKPCKQKEHKKIRNDPQHVS